MTFYEASKHYKEVMWQIRSPKENNKLVEDLTQALYKTESITDIESVLLDDDLGTYIPVPIAMMAFQKLLKIGSCNLWLSRLALHLSLYGDYKEYSEKVAEVNQFIENVLGTLD